MFEDNALDYVIARHVLEHITDSVKALREWLRVLKPGETMFVMLPDDTIRDSIALDPTHYHAYTMESAARFIALIPGLKIVRKAQVIPNWSFIIVAKKL